MYRPLLKFLPAFAVTISLVPVIAISQDVSTDSGTKQNTAAETESAVQAMIEKLSSTRFSDRQDATKQLLNVNADAVSLIEKAAASAIGETQSRLRMILPQLRKRLFDDQLAAFLAKPAVETAERLPQWNRFELISGHDDDALSIFGQVLSAERGLFAARLFAPNELSAMLESRSAEIARECHGRADEEFPIASVAALMLLGSEPEIHLRRATSTNISSALDDPRFNKLITDGVHSHSLRAIVEAWIVRSGIAAERPLLFSMQHGLHAGRNVATRIIKSKSSRPDMILSLLCLADLNCTDDLPLIESLFDNETVLWPQKGQIVRNLEPGAPPLDAHYTVQTRDVALAAAAHLRKIKPEDVGMKVRSSDVSLFAVDSLGFSSDEARSDSLAAYRKLADVK